MEVHIGVIHTPKEISFETDADATAVEGLIDDAISSGRALVWFEDSKGRKVGVPADKIGYVELITEDANRKMGFGL